MIAGSFAHGKARYLNSPLRCMVMWVLIVALIGLAGCSRDNESAPTYETRFEDFDSQDNQPLIVPVLPPLGYALNPALDARNWVPTGFKSGRVPIVTLCALGEGVDPAGVCFGTDDRDRIAVEESIVEGHRLVIVAASGDGFTADTMLAEWHSLAFTTAWKDLGWLDERSDAGR